MKLRHAAALALVGWYLMVPPRGVESKDISHHLFHDTKEATDALLNKTAEIGPDPTQPYSDWAIMSSYDTGGQCEQERRKYLEIAANAKEREYRDSQGQPLSDQIKISTKQYEFAVCIATDDPRLKGN
jgi:hypothetical protein